MTDYSYRIYQRALDVQPDQSLPKRSTIVGSEGLDGQTPERKAGP